MLAVGWKHGLLLAYHDEVSRDIRRPWKRGGRFSCVSLVSYRYSGGMNGRSQSVWKPYWVNRLGQGDERVCNSFQDHYVYVEGRS